jgi:hypothetical protein
MGCCSTYSTDRVFVLGVHVGRKAWILLSKGSCRRSWRLGDPHNDVRSPNTTYGQPYFAKGTLCQLCRQRCKGDW